MSQWTTPEGQHAGLPIHVAPVNDIFDHVTDGDPCPCLPRLCGNVLVHNSYDGRETGEACRKAIDLMGKALADHHHTWTDEERDAYEHAIAVLNTHWPTESE